MNPVLRFAVFYGGVMAFSFALAFAGFASVSPFIYPPLILLAAYASKGRGVGSVFAMTGILVLMNLTVTLGLAGISVLPGLVREFLAAPFLLTLWIASSLLIPGLLIAGGVWVRHIMTKARRGAP